MEGGISTAQRRKVSAGDLREPQARMVASLGSRHRWALQAR